MNIKNFKICDVIKFREVEVFSYEDEIEDEIEGTILLDKEYIIIDMFDGMIVISDGDLEFIIEDKSLEYAQRIRRMHFKVGDELKILNLKKLKFASETSLKQDGVYKVINIVPREGTAIIFDGTNEISLFPEELLFVEKVRNARSKIKKRKNEAYEYIPISIEVMNLQEEIKKFSLMTLIDKSLDERNFDILRKIVENEYLSGDK